MNTPAYPSPLRVDAPPAGLVRDSAKPSARVAIGASAALAVAAVASGLALDVNYGQYHPAALAYLAVALVACVVGVRKLGAGSDDGSRRLDGVVIGAALAVQFAAMLSKHPGVAELGPAVDLTPFRAGVALAAVATAVAMFGPPVARRLATPALLLVHFALGLWVLLALPRPSVDVATFQRDACAALLDGRNPYAMTFPDESPAGTQLYGAGLSVNGRLQFGYPYPPVTLLMAMPGHLLGDFRFAQLAAMTAAGALVAYAVPGRRATAAAALLLFSPRAFFVLQAGWTEPLVVVTLAAAVFAACRTGRDGRGRWVGLAVAFGLFVATKQYLVLALPAGWLLVAGRSGAVRLRFVVMACATAAAITLPLALWDVRAFVHSVALLQFHQPVRADALSFLVPASRAFGVAPGWLPFALALGAIVVSLRKCPRTPGGFALALGLTFLVFFAFSKQAFCNYYHLVIAGLCCAVAAWGGEVHRGDAEDAEVRRRGWRMED